MKLLLVPPGNRSVARWNFVGSSGNLTGGPLIRNLPGGKMDTRPNLQQIASFCGECSCGCPTLWVDPDAMPSQRVEITDDFGQRIQMSLAQFANIVEDAKKGDLDGLLRPAS
jgi:hypothetical protein